MRAVVAALGDPDLLALLGGWQDTKLDSDDSVVSMDRMTEEELLKGLEGLAPPEERPEPIEPDDEE